MDMGDATMNYTSTPQNNYKYNDQELQPDLNLMTYDFGARQYNPCIGRLTGVDLLAETYENGSPYNYIGNRQINNIDLNGMGFSHRIPCPKWGDESGGLVSGVTGALAAFVTVLFGNLEYSSVAVDKCNRQLQSQ